MSILWIQFSAISIPWGRPNPRKAVLLGKLVKQTFPLFLAFEISLTMSEWNMACSSTAWERSSEFPAWLKISRSNACTFPAFVKPTCKILFNLLASRSGILWKPKPPKLYRAQFTNQSTPQRATTQNSQIGSFTYGCFWLPTKESQYHTRTKEHQHGHDKVPTRYVADTSLKYFFLTYFIIIV